MGGIGGCDARHKIHGHNSALVQIASGCVILAIPRFDHDGRKGVIAVTIETIVAICVPCVALLFTVLTFSRNTKKETESAAAGRATMTADISYIRTSIDEIKVDNRVIQKDVSDMKAKLVEVEASAKSAHKRLDDLNAKG